MGRLDKFPFPVGWDTIVSDITQLKEKINKVYDFIDSMIDDWAYHDYAYAYNASDFFSRQKNQVIIAVIFSKYNRTFGTADIKSEILHFFPPCSLISIIMNDFYLFFYSFSLQYISKI